MDPITIDPTVADANYALRNAISNQQEAIALPSGFALHKITTHLQKPNRQTGSFHAEQLSDVLAYYNAHKDANSRIFVDSKDIGLTGVIDFGCVKTPGHKEHKAIWKAKPSAVFERLLRTNAWTQKDFAEFLEDHAVDLVALKSPSVSESADNTINYTTAIQAARTITLESAKNRTQEIGSFSASASAMEKVSAKVEHGMPQYLKLAGAAYLGSSSFMEVPVYVAVGLRTGDDKIGFSTRIMGLESIREQIAARLKDEAIKATTSAEVLTGQFHAG